MLRPLAEAGIDKAGVRRIARALGLPCAEKPAAPCLASRIPHFQEVVPAKLAQVEAAEAALRALGFTDLRVRHHGDVARVELPLADLPRAVSPPLREVVHRAVGSAGFRFVTVDLAGVQSGAFTLPLVVEGPPDQSGPPAGDGRPGMAQSNRDPLPNRSSVTRQTRGPEGQPRPRPPGTTSRPTDRRPGRPSGSHPPS